MTIDDDTADDDDNDADDMAHVACRSNLMMSASNVRNVRNVRIVRKLYALWVVAEKSIKTQSVTRRRVAESCSGQQRYVGAVTTQAQHATALRVFRVGSGHQAATLLFIARPAVYPVGCWDNDTNGRTNVRATMPWHRRIYYAIMKLLPSPETWTHKNVRSPLMSNHMWRWLCTTREKCVSANIRCEHMCDWAKIHYTWFGERARNVCDAHASVN